MPFGILRTAVARLRELGHGRATTRRAGWCLAFLLPAGIASAEPGRTFANVIACEKSRSLDTPTCRRAFATAYAQYETVTRSYPNRYACYRAFGPCMPWPAGGSPARFRPQLMAVAISDGPNGKSATPVVAAGRIKLAMAPRSIGAPLPSVVPDAGSLTSRLPDSTAVALCRQIEAVAAKEHLPSAFLARLLWQESSFRTHVVSPAGALGIAQFMPATAQERGLEDPFDAEKAIATSAGLLRDLNKRFGNLGLAAAAYNGGPARVSGWLQGRRTLAAETEDYVRRVTGRTVQDWSSPSGPGGLEALKSGSCLDVAGPFRRTAFSATRDMPQRAAHASPSIGSSSPMIPPTSSARAR